MTDAEIIQGNWEQGPVVCRLCGHRWRAVRPTETDEECLECPNCHHMTGEPDREQGDVGAHRD